MLQPLVEVILFTLQLWKSTCSTFYLAMDVIQKLSQYHLRFLHTDPQFMLLLQDQGKTYRIKDDKKYI